MTRASGASFVPRSTVDRLVVKAAAEGWGSARLDAAIATARELRLDAKGQKCGASYIPATATCHVGQAGAKPLGGARAVRPSSAVPTAPKARDWRKTAAQAAGIAAVGSVVGLTAGSFVNGWTPAGRRANARWAAAAAKAGEGVMGFGVAVPPAMPFAAPVGAGLHMAAQGMRRANAAARVSSSWGQASHFARSARGLARRNQARAAERIREGNDLTWAGFETQQAKNGQFEWALTPGQTRTARAYQRSADRSNRMAATRARAATRAGRISSGGDPFKSRPSVVEIARVAAVNPNGPAELRPLRPIGLGISAYMNVLRQQAAASPRRARFYGVRRPGR